MIRGKEDIINQLQKQLLGLQGYKPQTVAAVDTGLGQILQAFPNAAFPTGAVHEFVNEGMEAMAATSGFIAGLLAALMRNGGPCIWVSPSRGLFPPALKSFGVEPSNIIFADLQKEKEVLWALEEALKCGAIAAAVGEIKQISFVASRRLQLAVEESRVTGFVLRHPQRNPNPIACVARWQVTPLASSLQNGMPGVGYPRWKVELLKIRNGKPGTWVVQWAGGCFNVITPENERTIWLNATQQYGSAI